MNYYDEWDDLELVYRKPCLHFHHTPECGDCEHGLKSQCKINEAYLRLRKDLEELEELKKIMGTPIQDIMKRLKRLEKQDKILEEMREHIETIDYGEKCTYRYYVIIDGNRFDCCKETYDMWSRWLENGKD